MDRIVGFSDLGNTDDFTTEVMEWRLGVANGIHYQGDKSIPPYERVTKKMKVIGKNLRGSTKDNESDSDEDDQILTFDEQKHEAIDVSSLAKHCPAEVEDCLKELLDECSLSAEEEKK